MKFISVSIFGIGLYFALCQSVSAQQMADENFVSLKVLPDSINDITPNNMMIAYLHRQIDRAWDNWKSDYEKRTDTLEIRNHYKYLREQFIHSMGGLPDRTPLNQRVVGILECEKYRIEKIIFESRPKHFVTANLYIPVSTDFEPPYSGVLVPCGHYKSSKAHDEYQSMGALLALNGMAALIYDPIDQGERLQIRDNQGQFNRWGTRAHTLNDIRSILLGTSVAQNMVWDGMRAIDLLQLRPEINPNLIGCTGNSGGGTQTAYLTALDDRIKASAPSCYIHHLNSQIKESMGDAEQNIFGQLAYGMDHPDYLMMRGPIPIKILAATQDFFNIDAVWETYRYAKRFYSRLGYSERLDILENDAPHNYNRQQREAAAQWLARWLLGRDEIIREPELIKFNEQELQCTPGGQTLLMPDARSVQDLQVENLNRLLEKRKALWESNTPDQIRNMIRKNAGIKSWQEVPNPRAMIQSEINKDEYILNKIILMPEKGIYLPAVHYSPTESKSKKLLIYLHEYGKEFFAEEIGKRVGEGFDVLAIDLRGIGQTAQTNQSSMGQSIGLDWEDWYKGYLLGKSYVALRTEDIFSVIRHIHEINENNSLPIEVFAYGNTGIPLLHAVALEPALFSKIHIDHCLNSWADVINSPGSYNQLTSVQRGALKIYDLPDLVRLAGNKVSIENPVDALGLPIDGQLNDELHSEEPVLTGLAGVWYGSSNLMDPIGEDPVKSLELKWDAASKRGRTWSAEWFGWIKYPVTGMVSFHIETDKSVELFLDNKKGFKINGNLEPRQVTLQFEKGRLYPVRIVYNQKESANGYLSIKWVGPNGNISKIPANALHHSLKQHYKMKSAWR